MEAAEDVDGYVTASVRHFMTKTTSEADLPLGLSIEEATGEIARAIGLPEVDLENRAQRYELFVHRRNGGAEHLNPSARVGDAIAPGDLVEPLPEVTPGHPGA